MYTQQIWKKYIEKEKGEPPLKTIGKNKTT